MSWPSVTKDRLYNYKTAHETSYSKNFYQNVKPEGMDNFKAIILKHSHNEGENKTSMTNDTEISKKNSLKIRSKIYNKNVGNINSKPYKSQYEIYALLSMTARNS